MSHPDLKHILVGIDAALEVFSKNEGKLTAREISLKSLLTVARGQVIAELAAVSAGVQGE